MLPSLQRPPLPKYQVIKPQPQLATHRRHFLKLPHEEYELAVVGEVGIRRYRVETDKIDRLLQIAEWRHEVGAPVVGCVYLGLLSPVATWRKVNTELYLDHIEVPLSKLKKLLLHEAMYLML
jgi:hypothetical protein